MSIKTGISTASFFPDCKTEEALKVVQTLGADCCEVFLSTFSEYKKEFGDLLVDIKGDFCVHSVHSLNNHFEPELFNVSERTRGDADALFCDVCDIGRRLGAKFYTFHGPSILKKNEYHLNPQKVGNGCLRLTELISKYDMELSYENVYWAYYNFPDFFPIIKEYAPKLRCTLDLKQARRSEIDWEEYLSKMGKSLSTVHLSDYDNNGILCPPGKGIVDFYKLFSLINELDIDVSAVIELYRGNFGELDELKASYDYIKEIAYKASK